jgi:magnesium-transporting ATPase (P-type)
MLDIVFMHQDHFRARIAVPEWLSICYNVFFTSIHILPVLVFDKDLPDSMANNSPSLYWPGPQRKLFNAQIFTLWMLVGVYHGVVCWMIPFVLLKPTVDDYDKGETSTFWLTSVSAFTAVILTVCLKLVMVSQNPASRYTVVPTILALVVYVCYAIGLSKTQTGNLFQPCMRSVPDLLLESDSAKLGIVVSPIVALLPDALCYAVYTACWPTELQKVQHKQDAPPDVLRQDPAPMLS